MITPFSTATEMLSALQNKEISAVELLDMHLAQIAQLNPQLNGIVTPNYEGARETAVSADSRRAKGEEAPLLGLPIVVKDCLYMAGLPTTGGLVERAEMIDEQDSRNVASLRQAGAVIMGKTNIPPYAADWQADNPVFGRSNNPWDVTRTPGGSTGGGAATVAAGMSPLEFGGDLGGSIRLPAAFCGIFGHKSSETAVPRSGHFPGRILPNGAVYMAAQGPLARSATDLRLGLNVIAGPDIGEDVAWTLKLPPARHQKLSDYRVVIMPPLDWVVVDDAIQAGLDNLATQLGKAGATVTQAMPEGFADLRSYYALYMRILSMVAFAGMSLPKRQKIATAYQKAGTFDMDARVEGLLGSASDAVVWFDKREQYRQSLRDFFKEYDILLAPVTNTLAFVHDQRPFTQRTLQINGQETPYDRITVYPSLGNLSGHPGTAFPVGLSPTGLPVGVQALGPYLEDMSTIRFVELVDQAFGGYQIPPNLG